MKNLKNLGTILSKIEQKMISGGDGNCSTGNCYCCCWRSDGTCAYWEDRFVTCPIVHCW